MTEEKKNSSDNSFEKVLAEPLDRRTFLNKSVKYGIGGLVGVSLFASFLAACSKAPVNSGGTDNKGEIVVAAVVALTGPNAAWGQKTWDAFQMACDIINENGGIESLGGAKLKYIVGDTESKPEIASSQTQSVIEKGAVVVIGCNQSAATMIATQVCERQKVPFITGSDVDSKITSRGFKYTFMVPPVQEAYANTLLNYVKEMGEKTGQKVNKIAVLCENSTTGQDAAKAAEKVGKNLGFDVVDVSTYDASTTPEVSGFISKYKSAGVELVIGHNKPNDAIEITRQMKQLRYNPMAYAGMLGGHTSEEYINVLGTDADYVLATAGWNDDVDIPGMEELKKKYTDRFNENMDVQSAAGFSVAALIWHALETTKSNDRDKLRDAIASVNIKSGDKNFLHVPGCKFDNTGYNELASGVVMQIKDKQRRTVYPFDLAKTESVWPKPVW
ncbi:ABC transporter substrate-binding protein [Bacillus sp. JJ1773]|uniref:ABC transporter substrate-binding protein n=1 Tax=Bacillus sp. JJ1773 TaxID=3122965 RepID=UPI002FFE4581